MKKHIKHQEKYEDQYSVLSTQNALSKDTKIIFQSWIDPHIYILILIIMKQIEKFIKLMKTILIFYYVLRTTLQIIS